MTIFGCSECSCECPSPCSLVDANCFIISFSGFESDGDPNYSCQPCDRLDSQTIVAQRADVRELVAQAFAVRPSGPGIETPIGAEDAEFEVTLSRDEVTGAYSVSGIDVTNGGAAYIPGTTLRFEFGFLSPEDGSFLITDVSIDCDRNPFSWITEFGRARPSVTASAACDDFSDGPALTVSLTQNNEDGDEPTWGVDSVSLVSAASCEDGTEVIFGAAPGVVVESAASAVIRASRQSPTISASVGGALIYGVINFTVTQDAEGKDVYVVQGITSPYVDTFSGSALPSPGDEVVFTPSQFTTVVSQAVAVIEEVTPFGDLVITVTDGGGYFNPNGEIEAIEVTNPGAYYAPGAIKSVEVVRGGEIYKARDDGECRFVGSACTDCGFGTVTGSVEFGKDQSGQEIATLSIIAQFPFGRIDATASGFEPNPTTLTFTEFSTQTLCPVPGSVTVTAGNCNATPQRYCNELPQQIEVKFSGFGAAGILDDNWPSDQPALFGQVEAAANELCDTESAATCFAVQTGGQFGVPPTAAGTGGDRTVIFDLAEEDRGSCGNGRYYSQVPGGWSWQSPDLYQCLLNGFIDISANECRTAVAVERQGAVEYENDLCPSDDTCPDLEPGDLGNATASVSSATDGVIDSISVDSPGRCYAWNLFSYSEPEGEVSAITPLGSGATFEATFEEVTTASGKSEWRVAVVTGQGGSGYIDGDRVIFTPAEGSCGKDFSGEIITNRTEPDLTLNLPSPGSGGQISYTASEVSSLCSYQYGATSGAVAAAGTGYTDGSAAAVSISGEGEVVTDAVVSIVVERTEPSVTATVGDATLEVVLSETEVNGKPEWSVSAVNVTDGGTGGVSNGSLVTFATDADIEQSAAFATADADENGVVTNINLFFGGSYYNNTGPISGVNIESPGYYCGPSESQAPSLTASLTGGSGGSISLSASLERFVPCETYWQITEVAVDSAGDGYRDRSEIAIDLTDDGVIDAMPSAIVRVARSEPTITATVGNATLSVSLVEFSNLDGDAVWYVGSVSVDAGGSGVEQGEAVAFSLASGTVVREPVAYANVDETGAVTSVVVIDIGEVVDDIGPIESVEITQNGRFWDTDTSVGCVNILNGGRYHKATRTGVYVATPTVEVFSNCGSGATAEAVVDADPDSETFGGITAINVTDGGEGYFPFGKAWQLAAYFDVGGFQLLHLNKRQPWDSVFSSFYPSLPVDYDPCDFDFLCRGFYGNDFGFTDFEPLQNRHTTECPSELLSREYRFWAFLGVASGLRTAIDGDECGKYLTSLQGGPDVGSGFYTELLVRRFGDSDIKITIAPVE